MTPLPTDYDSPAHLPFNATGLKGFTLTTPDQEIRTPDGLWVILRGNELLLKKTSEGVALPAGALPPLPGEHLPLQFGIWQDHALRVLSIERETEPPLGFFWESLLSSEPRMGLTHLSLGGIGGQILHWERNSRFCSRCGETMTRLPGEWGKKCRGCGYAHFPHIHPCVIVVVRRPGEVLLTRKAQWPPNRYSLVAGFLDFGECLEEAVAREVLEETGISVKNVRYIGSQSWPFPSQLMAGFTADYAGGEIVVQESELEDARWFSVGELPTLPPQRSIARYLIDRWAVGGE